MTASSKEQVILHAGAARWSWRRLGRLLEGQSQGESAPGAVDWPGSAPVRVLVDASQCVGLRLELPRMSAGRQAQALRWAAEEHLASSAEDEHVVAGPRDDADRLCCVVIGQEPMNTLMAFLEHQAVEQVVPDALCLPFEAGHVSLAAIQSRVLARWGDWDFGSFEPELIGELLAALPEESRLHWYGGDLPESLQSLPLEQRSEDALDVLAKGLEDAPINLLAGDFASDSSQVARSYWRYAAIAAAVTTVLALGSAWLELEMLESRSADLVAELDARFATAFPGVTPAGRHLEQAQRQLSSLRFGEAAGLLDLMNRAAPVIAGQSTLVLDAMSFREGRLEFVVRAPDGAALENLARRLRALSLEAELRSLRLEEGGTTSGRLLLTQAGGA